MKNRLVPVGLLMLLLLLSLACGTLTGVKQDVNNIKGTAQSVVTDAVGMATEGVPLAETVQAFATEVPSLKDTAQAAITQNPQIVETVQAIATQGINQGSAPSDIPVVDESTIKSFYGSDVFVSYTTSQDFQTVVDFYKNEMPANGWEADPTLSFEIKDATTLSWDQVDRKAIVVITINPTDKSTIVVITISAK